MYGHHWKPITRNLCDIAEAYSLAVTCGPFFVSALQQSHGYVIHSSAMLLTTAAGWLVLRRVESPYLDSVRWIELRLWCPIDAHGKLALGACAVGSLFLLHCMAATCAYFSCAHYAPGSASQSIATKCCS
jgi:hypothetical protein